MPSFYKEREIRTLQQLEDLKARLPSFCNRFFLGVSSVTAPLTRLNYAYDLRIFFEFLITQIEEFVGKKIYDLDMQDLEKVTTLHIELFTDYLSHYIDKDGAAHSNDERAKVRKLSCLRAFFKYYFKKGELSRNVLPNVDLPKVHDKPILRLDMSEIARIIDAAEEGGELTAGQQRFHGHTRLRDTTILIFFLTTGVRISELVGLNFGDIDMKNSSFRIVRKGGNTEVLFMADELHSQMIAYLESCGASPQPDEPLFKSLQDKRISVRAVQNLVKKYARIAAPLKNISPHKLRSTFGTNLYRETKDIYIVADVLGHKDVNTTKKHYAAISEDIRRAAAKRVKLTPSSSEE